MPEIKIEDFERVLENKLKPICDDILEIKITMFGPEGRTGVSADVTKALDLVKRHEIILLGKEGDSGIIKKINYLWLFASTGATGLFWKIWDYLLHNQPPPPPHH